MKNNDVTYLNFPLSLLKYAFCDIRVATQNMIDFGIYKRALKIEGDDLETQMKNASKALGIKLYKPEPVIRRALEVNSNFGNDKINVSANKNILFNFRDSKKTDFEIACFCAYCAVKSILGSKQYVRTNKGFILGRMLGLNKRIEIDRGGKESISFTKKEAFEYVYDVSFLEININTINGAIRTGELKMNECNKIKRSDLHEWIEVKRESSDTGKTGIEYISRRRFNNVMTELQLNWGLSLIEEKRGYILSFDLSIDELANISISTDRKNKIELIKMAKQEAIQKNKNKFNLN